MDETGEEMVLRNLRAGNRTSKTNLVRARMKFRNEEALEKLFGEQLKKIDEPTRQRINRKTEKMKAKGFSEEHVRAFQRMLTKQAFAEEKRGGSW